MQLPTESLHLSDALIRARMQVEVHLTAGWVQRNRGGSGVPGQGPLASPPSPVPWLQRAARSFALVRLTNATGVSPAGLGAPRVMAEEPLQSSGRLPLSAVPMDTTPFWGPEEPQSPQLLTSAVLVSILPTRSMEIPRWLLF